MKKRIYDVCHALHMLPDRVKRQINNETPMQEGIVTFCNPLCCLLYVQDNTFRKITDNTNTRGDTVKLTPEVLAALCLLLRRGESLV